MLRRREGIVNRDVKLRANHHARRQPAQLGRRDVEHRHHRERGLRRIHEVVTRAVVSARAELERLHFLNRRSAQRKLSVFGGNQATIEQIAIEVGQRDFGVLEGAQRRLHDAEAHRNRRAFGDLGVGCWLRQQHAASHARGGRKLEVLPGRGRAVQGQRQVGGARTWCVEPTADGLWQVHQRERAAPTAERHRADAGLGAER